MADANYIPSVPVSLTLRRKLSVPHETYSDGM